MSENALVDAAERHIRLLCLPLIPLSQGRRPAALRCPRKRWKHLWTLSLKKLRQDTESTAPVRGKLWERPSHCYWHIAKCPSHKCCWYFSFAPAAINVSATVKLYR